MSTLGRPHRLPIDPVTWDIRTWAPRVPAMYSRAERARQTGEYSAAVPTLIADWAPVIDAELSADVDDASQSLVRFSAHARATLGPEAAAIGPMSAVLLRTESASSSQIEQLTTSAEQLALAELGEGARANAEAVVANVRAMEAAHRLSGDVSAQSILSMHGALMEDIGAPADRAEAGRFRREQVWIGPGEAGPLQADFVPPGAERIRPAIDDLVRFAARADLPVLVQAAVAHAQFETIHPFADGNGRTGRALAHAMLRGAGLVGDATVPLSAGLLIDIAGYFDALGAFRSGDAAPIVRVFAQAGRFASATGEKLIDALAAELRRSEDLLRGIRSDAAARRVLPLLVGQPVVSTRYIAERLAVSDMTASRALAALTDRGVVVEATGRRRGRLWRHSGMLAVLDAYAASLRRHAPPGR